MDMMVQLSSFILRPGKGIASPTLSACNADGKKHMRAVHSVPTCEVVVYCTCDTTNATPSIVNTSVAIHLSCPVFPI